MNWLHSILGWFSTDFRKLKILSKHLLSQSRVREFQPKQDSQKPGFSAGFLPKWRTCPWVWSRSLDPDPTGFAEWELGHISTAWNSGL